MRAIAALMLPGFASIALATSSLAAQTRTVTGRVTDNAGRPLADAAISILDLGRTALSDSSGGFSLRDIPAGAYTLDIRRSGFAPALRHIDANASSALTIALTPMSSTLPAVTVTASRSPLEVFETPLPIASPSAEVIRRNHSISLAQAIGGLPAVHALSTGQQIGKPVIRGLAGSRVLVLQNGLRLEDYSWSDEDGPSIDTRLADRIEIIRGPASLMYGSDAIGGVVNVIPQPLPESMDGRSHTHFSAELYGGTNAREIGTVLQGEGASGDFGWRATAIGRFGGTMHTPDGPLKNTNYGASSGQLSVGMHKAWGSASLRYDRYGGEFHLHEANEPPPGLEGIDAGPERKNSDDRVQFIASIPLGNVRIEPKLQWQRHWLSELADAAEVGGSGFVETTIFDLLLNTLSADMLVHIDASDRLRTTLGVSGILQDNDSRAKPPGLAFVPDAKLNTMAAFGIGQLQLGSLSLLGGVRADHRTVDSDANAALQLSAEERTSDALTGNIGAALHLSSHVTLNANLGRSWRAPNLFELFSNGPLLAEGRYVIGNSSLEPEFGTNVDAGLRLSLGRLRGEVAAFTNDIDDYIYLSPTDEFRDKPGAPDDSIRVFRYQAATASLEGVEAGLEFSATDHLTLRTRYDVVRGRNDVLDENLPLMPPPRVDIEGELHTPSFHGLGESYVTAGVEFETRQTHLNPLDFPTDAFTLINLGAGIQPVIAHHRFHVDVRVRNAANTGYRSFLSRYKEFSLDPGRDIILRISSDY